MIIIYSKLHKSLDTCTCKVNLSSLTLEENERRIVKNVFFSTRTEIWHVCRQLLSTCSYSCQIRLSKFMRRAVSYDLEVLHFNTFHMLIMHQGIKSILLVSHGCICKILQCCHKDFNHHQILVLVHLSLFTCHKFVFER